IRSARYWFRRFARLLAAFSVALLLFFGLDAALFLCGQLGVGLQRRHRLLDLRQPFRLIAGPVRHLVTTLVFAENLVLLDIRRLGGRQHASDLGFQFRRAFLHAFITHRFMFRRIGFDLRAIQCDVAELDQPCCLAQLQNLEEQLAERLQMALAEVADRSEVRRIERDNHHEIVPLAAGSSNAPRRIQPACIAMQQKRNHHARIERRLAEPTHIAAHDGLEIQTLPHQPNDKPRDVVLGHEVPHIRRQKQRAHSSVLDFVFYDGAQFPAEYKGNAFVALKGSWNRAEPTGYKVVRVPFKDGRPEGYYENFVTGFWASGERRAEVWGRPAALAVTRDGTLLVADDTGGTIWRIAYTGQRDAAPKDEGR